MGFVAALLAALAGSEIRGPSGAVAMMRSKVYLPTLMNMLILLLVMQSSGEAHKPIRLRSHQRQAPAKYQIDHADNPRCVVQGLCPSLPSPQQQQHCYNIKQAYTIRFVTRPARPCSEA